MSIVKKRTRMDGVDEALNRLADKIDCGHLELSARPVIFIDSVIAKLEERDRYRDRLDMILANTKDENIYPNVCIGHIKNLCEDVLGKRNDLSRNL